MFEKCTKIYFKGNYLGIIYYDRYEIYEDLQSISFLKDDIVVFVCSISFGYEFVNLVMNNSCLFIGGSDNEK